MELTCSGSEEESTYLTKGDNNHVHDQQLYQRGKFCWIRLFVGQYFLPRDYIYGKSLVYAPYFGMFTIWTSDYPYLRYILLGVMGLFILTGKE